MPNYETLGWSLSDGVATITFNRPRAGNALTMQMGQELMDASIRCDDDPEVQSGGADGRKDVLRRSRPEAISASWPEDGNRD